MKWRWGGGEVRRLGQVDLTQIPPVALGRGGEEGRRQVNSPVVLAVQQYKREGTSSQLKYI